MKVSKKLAIIGTILMSVAIGSGCTTQKKPLPSTPTRNVPPSAVTPAPRAVPPSSITPAPRVLPPSSLNPFHTAGVSPSQATKTANKLASKITKLRNVNSATVVIVGSTAYVGLQIKPHVLGVKTTTLARDVVNLVKRTDKKIKTVTVLTDAASIATLKSIAQGVATGKPISTFTSELAKIGRSITPTVK